MNGEVLNSNCFSAVFLRACTGSDLIPPLFLNEANLFSLLRIIFMNISAHVMELTVKIRGGTDTYIVLITGEAGLRSER